MKIKPIIERNTSVGGRIGSAKWRYDPAAHAEGLEVTPEVGRALLKSGHWIEVESKPKKVNIPSAVKKVDKREEKVASKSHEDAPEHRAFFVPQVEQDEDTGESQRDGF